MKDIRVVFMGTPDFAVSILDALILNTNVVMVVTQPDKLVGRKKELKSSPVKERALDQKIEVFQPDNIKIDFEKVRECNPDLIVTCAYGQIVPKEVLDIPKLGCINVHASLLPKYRGGAPIQHAIINGDTITGITIMYMDIGMDTGDIISRKELPIDINDTSEMLHDKLSKLGAELLLETLPEIIKGTNPRIKQNLEEVSYAPVIKREDEHLDFNDTALNIYNKVRGLNSWPLANMIFKGEECKVIEGYMGEDKKGIPGEIVDIKKDAIGIKCLDKVYYITKLKPFGKKAMEVKDYLNGIEKNSLLGEKVL